MSSGGSVTMGHLSAEEKTQANLWYILWDANASINLVGISMQGSTLYYGKIRLAELILLETTPDLDDRHRIEGYLAHKWGIAAKLGTHEYDLAAPSK